jgi:dephospho-CoA kinase
MLKAGLTGNIGSGKSFVGGIFSALGIPVYYSDQRAKQLMESEPLLIKRIQETFGESIYHHGSLQAEILAAIAFKSKSKIETLNAIVHPFVIKDFEKWYSLHEEKPYVLLESALVFETGLDKMLDKVIAVTAPEKLRQKRVMERQGMTEEKFAARQRFQFSETELTSRADFVIVNDGIHPLLRQVVEIDAKLRENA